MKTLKVKDKIWVQWNGRLYALSASEPASARKSAEEALELVAPFSCKVLKIYPRDGQSVKKGDPVAVVEAMKMEYSYAAPRDGMIAKVNVKEGEIVPAGQAFVQWGSK